MATWVGATGDADLSGVAANYLKAKASTQFGTRQLIVLNIAATAVGTNFANANSLFSQTIRALQQTAEVHAVFTPLTNSVNVIVSNDSQWDGVTIANQAGAKGGAAGDASYNSLEAALAAGVDGTVAFTVTVPAGFVNPFNG